MRDGCGPVLRAAGAPWGDDGPRAPELTFQRSSPGALPVPGPGCAVEVSTAGRSALAGPDPRGEVPVRPPPPDSVLGGKVAVMAVCGCALGARGLRQGVVLGFVVHAGPSGCFRCGTAQGAMVEGSLYGESRNCSSRRPPTSDNRDFGVAGERVPPVWQALSAPVGTPARACPRGTERACLDITLDLIYR